MQSFGVPKQHPKSKAFVDHVIAFYILDGRIWFRQFQIGWKPKGKLGKDEETRLIDVGPRFVLQPIRTFEGSFGGPTLFKNEGFERPGLKKRRAQFAADAQEHLKLMKEQQQNDDDDGDDDDEGEEAEEGEEMDEAGDGKGEGDDALIEEVRQVLKQQREQQGDDDDDEDEDEEDEDEEDEE